MLIAHSCRKPTARAGMAMAMLAVLLISIMGILGLVIDSGFLMASYRDAQNAADSAALAAAMELYYGQSADTAKKAAETFVKDYNGLKNATVTVNSPPAIGPHAGNVRYAEVVVTNTRKTFFIQMLGIAKDQEVKGRAVAGYEAVASGEGAIVLDPNARPGLSIDGGATLRVNGAVIVNSKSGGIDQYGAIVDWGLQKYALSASNNSKVEAQLILVKGGVDVVENYKPYDPDGPSPLYCRGPISPDPLRELPVPTDANGVNTTPRGAVSLGTSSPKPSYLEPGIYEDILINGSAEVIFKPGIYVMSPKKPNQGLRINGGPNVSGTGVMFYLTGSNYSDPLGYGYWDHQDDILNSYLDGPLPPTNGPDTLPAPPDPNFNKVDFATLDINATGAKVVFTGLQDEKSIYNNMLFFQRRRNMNTAQVQGVAGTEVILGGTIYDKWGHFHLAGESKYDAQFVVGSMSVSGQALVVLNSTGKSFGRANLVFLAE